MYKNIGKKLKTVATILFYVVLIVEAFYFVVLLCESFYLAAFVVLIFAFPSAWLSTALLYAFGELVDKVCDIRTTLHGTAGKRTPVDKKHAKKASPCKHQRTTSYTRPPHNEVVEIVCGSPANATRPFHVDDDGVDVICPQCLSELWYPQELLNEPVSCLYCNKDFVIEGSQDED